MKETKRATTYPEEKLPILQKKANAPPFEMLAERVKDNPERLAKIFEWLWHDAYSRGLRDMDQMHQIVDKK